ncbi:hypothetical protein B0H13DRAFT_964807 [Mycena leptocephala]|nr:hypothetical protein B0H13DRAFT_964807 [Mycena leptocephala]
MTLLFYIALLISAAHSYTPGSKMGPSNFSHISSLFIQGGKQGSDPSQTYSSALAQEDLLFLRSDFPFPLIRLPGS